MGEAKINDELRADDAQPSCAQFELDLTPERCIAWLREFCLRAPSLGVLIGELLREVPDSGCTHTRSSSSWARCRSR
jgi:hypothetical protein